MTNLLQTISNDHLTVKINPLGAQLWSIQGTEGAEYLWQGDLHTGRIEQSIFSHISPA